MTTDNRFVIRSRWQDVTLALLPGLALVAQKSGLLPLGGSSLPVSSFYAVPLLCLVLVLVSLLRERRFAIWSYPALGIVLAVGLATLIGPIYLLAPLLHLSDWVNPFLASLIVWGTLIVLAVHYRVVSMAPKAFWLLLVGSIGAFVLLYSMDIFTPRGVQTVEPAMMAATVSTIILGWYLLPVLIAWPLARQHGTTAALVVLGAEFFFYDTVSDPGYAIRMLTQDPTIPQMVDQLPAIGFLIICPLWALTARSSRSQVIGFLLPSSLALVITELLSGAVRPYFTPVMWLRRGLGASEFILILALAIVAYHALHTGRVGSENGLQPARGTA